MEQKTKGGPVARLSAWLETLPGVGPKVARRAAGHIARMTPEQAEELATAIERATTDITVCGVCRNLADSTVCGICSDATRDAETICVVEQTKDLIAIENCHIFDGHYHVLHGTLSPANGVTPEDLEIVSLIERAEAHTPDGEIILATNPSLEGDATADYISRQLGTRCPGLKVTRLARGMPSGADVNYADVNTLTAAITKRQPLQ